MPSAIHSYYPWQDITLPLDDLPFKATSTARLNVNLPRSKQSHGPSLTSTVRLFRSSHVDMLVTPLCMHVIKTISDEIYGSVSVASDIH